MLETMLPVVSSFGPQLDSLIHMIYFITGVFFFVMQALLVWILWRYRRSRQAKAVYETGETWREMRWIGALALLVVTLDFAIDFKSARAWETVKLDLPSPDLTVRVVAQQFQWTFVYPGTDGRFDAGSDVTVSRDLHLPVNSKALLLLRSRDVIHSFFVPAARLKQDILPGREIPAWLEMTVLGTTPLVCSQLCGVAHTAMGGEVVVQSPEEFKKWLNGLRTPPKKGNS